MKKTLQKAILKLEQTGIPSAILDAQLLLAFVLGKSREFILTHLEDKLEPNQKSQFSKLINRRAKNWPVAYLTGHKEFYGLNFIVDKNTLVPRPETEIMVDEVLKLTKKTDKATIIDIGTGSGCVIIALAKKLANKCFTFYAIDVSRKALDIAKQNAVNNNTDFIIFSHNSLLTGWHNQKLDIKNLIITANLPYLTPDQTDNEPSISREPRLALVSGADGLKHYRQLFTQIKKLKANNPQLNIIVLTEINPDQADKFELIAKSISKAEINFETDLSGKIRIAVTNIF